MPAYPPCPFTDDKMWPKGFALPWWSVTPKGMTPGVRSVSDSQNATQRARGPPDIMTGADITLRLFASRDSLTRLSFVTWVLAWGDSSLNLPSSGGNALLRTRRLPTLPRIQFSP